MNQKLHELEMGLTNFSMPIYMELCKEYPQQEAKVEIMTSVLRSLNDIFGGRQPLYVTLVTLRKMRDDLETHNPMSWEQSHVYGAINVLIDLIGNSMEGINGESEDNAAENSDNNISTE